MAKQTDLQSLPEYLRNAPCRVWYEKRTTYIDGSATSQAGEQYEDNFGAFIDSGNFEGFRNGIHSAWWQSNKKVSSIHLQLRVEFINRRGQSSDKDSD